MPSHRRGGAYGFEIKGVEADGSQLIDAPGHWPSIELRVRISNGPLPRADHLGPRTATLRLRSGGSVLVERGAGRATFSLPARPHPAALLHPYLAPAAMVASYWRGREGFHAGAFVAGGGVWGLLGEKGSGKSTTLAALADAGTLVFCDDVLILDNGIAFAGPRSIDLRGDVAHRFGAAEPLGVIGQRERWRLALGPTDPELPLRGWVALRWADETSIRSLRGGERIRELLPHRGLRVPPLNGKAPIELSALPFLELSRRKGWDSLPEALERLLEATGS